GQKYRATKVQRRLRPGGAKLDQEATATYLDYKPQANKIAAAIGVEEAKRITFPEIRGFYDLPGEPKTPLLRRGDYLKPGPEVPPGTLVALATTQRFAWNPPGKDAKTSGRRLAFAEWLTQPNHPLTARVLVNRLWLHHFGEGLVATPDNFGKTGSPPSHPELLDWLATEFVARGWSIKTMHRLMMTSSAYRQSSRFDPKLHQAGQKLDPEVRLLWRQRLRRLEAEAIRDSVLCVAGALNLKMFGPPVKMQPYVEESPELAAGDETNTTPDSAGARRSFYLQVRRSQPLTFLQAFDQPKMETNCTRRTSSTVSSQALVLMNSDFMIRQASAFAARVEREKRDDPAGYAVQLAFGRVPTPQERAELQTFLANQKARYEAANTGEDEARRQALADLCHMLLSANDFVYVD